jgi:hypothetical protein
MAATNIQVVTGSDAFILTSANADKQVTISNPGGNEFRLTITIAFEEFRQPSQQVGSLWLNYLLGTTTTSLPGIEAAVPVENPNPKNNYFVIVTRGEVVIHYTGQASMHVWLSYYAELPS